MLTGGSGQLGTALRAALVGRDDVLAPGRTDLDLSDPAGVVAVLDDVRPGVVVNAGAWTAVDDAESHERAATVVNGASVAAMAGWAADNDAWLVTFSTDYVFDGTGDEPYLEGHPTASINAYGRSKVVGEEAALDSGSALVVRTSWVVSETHDNFASTMLSLLDRGVDPRVVDDQHGCPTIATDLAAAVVGLVDDRPAGLLHLTNDGATTWYELAREVARLGGHDPERVSPCGTDEFPTAAARPAWSVLGSRRRDELGVETLPRWTESLPAVVHAQQARSAG
nr:dTDP-4-dehydrorhamnose reductase [Salsipaludibacter albus]